MSGCRLTALLVFLFILTGGSLGFTVVLEHSNLYVGVGRDAIFTVRPSAAIASGTWSFKGKTFINWIGTNLVINPAYSSRVNISLTTGTLTLKTVTKGDSGDYIVAVNEQDTNNPATATVKLLALEPVSNVQLHSNRSAAVENQHSVLLTCSSNGTHLRWEWLLNDKPVQQNDRINISRDTLLIDPVNRSDAGTYKCIVRNGLNSGSAETTLQVHFGPDNMKITPRSPVNIEVGEDRTLTCSAQSEPIPTYVWSKGTVGFPKGPKLTISSANKEHSGIYTCHVSNAELRTNNSLTAEVIVQDASLPTGAIVGIVIAVIVVVAGITGGIVCLVRAKMNRLKSGSSNGDCKMSPRGNIPMLQTEYAAIGRKLPGPQQLEPSNNGNVASPAQTREGDVIYISPHIINPSMNPIGEVFIDNKTDYAELKHR